MSRNRTILNAVRRICEIPVGCKDEQTDSEAA